MKSASKAGSSLSTVQWMPEEGSEGLLSSGKRRKVGGTLWLYIAEKDGRLEESMLETAFMSEGEGGFKRMVFFWAPCFGLETYSKALTRAVKCHPEG
jgi:hypothetical protein